MAKMITEEKKNPSGKSVLLFSGGMDSLIMNHLLSPDILLIFWHNNTYEKQEKKAINELIKNNMIDQKKIIIDSSFSLSKIERDDAIIPNRNLLFIAQATNYGEVIYLGSVYGDRSFDKSLKFLNRCEDLFDYLYSEQHWCSAHTFKILAPFKALTKTQLVNKFLTNNGDASHLLTSRSCYSSTDKPCGWCKPCFRKWVALKNNQINMKNYFENLPQDAPFLSEILPLVKRNEYRGKEDFEILNALNTQ
jgi:7-cyano-7-deazaguanine synthase in queuosine biosynthesis